MNLADSIRQLVQLANEPYRYSRAAQIVLEALKTIDGAKACTAHVWAEIGEPTASEPARPPSPIELIRDERERQQIVEAFDSGHDDDHTSGEIAYAAACYALPDRDDARMEIVENIWPWSPDWWKPTPEDREKELVKAAALCVAEIERLRRLKSSSR